MIGFLAGAGVDTDGGAGAAEGEDAKVMSRLRRSVMMASFAMMAFCPTRVARRSS